MKKQLLIGASILFSALSANAQQETKSADYWFIAGQAGVGYTVGEQSFGKLISPAAALSIGKSFNPIIAARLRVSGWEGKAGWSSIIAEHPVNNYSFNYVQTSLDAMFNLTNVFGQYKADRCFNLIGIIGIGYAHSFNYGQVPELKSAATVNSAVASAGLQGDFRLNNAWSINLELMGNALNDAFNAKAGSVNDWKFDLLAGVTCKFGYKAAKPITCPNTARIASLNEKINQQRQEIVELQNQLQAKLKVEERIKTVIEKTIEAYIPFKIGKSHIEADQLIHLYRVAQHLKENPSTTAIIAGYADAQTGSKAVNKKISLLRAQAVADALTGNYGIEASRITVESKGADTQPFDENNWNRVAIMMTL